MKAYICDSCHVAVTNPWWVRMMVYTYKPHRDPNHEHKKSEERNKRCKIHLCEACFANLNKICEKASKERGDLDKLKLWETLLKAESHAPIIKKAKSDAVRDFSKELMDVGDDGFISRWDIVDANANYQKRLKGE